MRFSIFTTVLAAGSFISGGLALPLGLPSLTPSQALSIVSAMNAELSSAAQGIDSAVSGIVPASVAADKQQAVELVAAQLSRMTAAVEAGTGALTQQASAVAKGLPAVNVTQLAGGVAPQAKATAQDVANAMNLALGEVSGVASMAVSVLGAEPLVDALTPLRSSVGSLVSTISPLVAELQPLLQVANGVPGLSTVEGALPL